MSTTYDRKAKRPHLWMTGPDETRHQQFNVFRQQKNQANWRKEGWELDFEDWVSLWGDKWAERGRKPEQYCMTRISDTDSWNQNNVIVIKRIDFFQVQSRKPRKTRSEE